MKKYLHYLGNLLVACIFVGAVYLLYHKLKAYSIDQIRASISSISYGGIALSLVLMVINYGILIGYDWLALKAIHKPLPLGRTSLVSFVGQAVSYNFGALLGGTTVRYRFYSSWGFSLSDIVRLVVMLAVTFWVGALGLCGTVFLFAPPIIPPELAAKMPVHDMRLLGAVLLGIALAYLVSCFFVRKPLNVFGKEFEFPRPRIAIAQAVVAGVDLIAAAACMYVLLPEALHISFIQFLPSYLLAQVAVVLTHIPGGVGVFELVILHMTDTPDATLVFAAVLLFRLIYYIIPLLAAAVILAVYEVRQKRDALRDAGRWLSVLSHSVAALATFAAGVVMLVSAILPTLPATRALLENWLPPFIPIVADVLCVVSGLALLFLAYGLERRQIIAFRWSAGFLAAGIAACLAKGWNLIEALMIGVVLVTVFLARRRFYRRSLFYEEKIPPQWYIPVAVVTAALVSMAYFIYTPVWDRASTWGFDNTYNMLRVLCSMGTAAVLFVVVLLWRTARRHRCPPGKS